MKMIYLGIAIFIVLTLVYIFSAQKIGVDRVLQFYIRFDTTNIHGNIDYVKIGYHGSVFKIKGTEKEFVFYPYTGELNDYKIFYNLGEKGDIIIKQAYSDTLKLLHNNKVYLYTFQEFND